MDLSISATTASYLPPQAYSPQGGTGRLNAVAEANVRASTPAQVNVAQAGTTGSQSATALDKQTQEVSKRSPAAGIAAKPGYTFEVDQQNHKIMKVSDTKGVLIYQVPSKGQLALIEAQDNARKSLQLTA